MTKDERIHAIKTIMVVHLFSAYNRSVTVDCEDAEKPDFQKFTVEWNDGRDIFHMSNHTLMTQEPEELAFSMCRHLMSYYG